MDKKDWIYVLGVVVLVLTSILCYFEKITTDQLMQIFLLVIAALITGTAFYVVGQHKGFKEGSANIG